MIRLIGLAILILGLIIQSMVVAVPVTMTNENHEPVASSESGVMPHDIHHRIDQPSDKSSKHSEPCHQQKGSTTKAHSESCDMCDMQCIDGMCATSCTSGGMVVFNNEQVNLSRLNKNLVCHSLLISSPNRFPSLIFHPPKHA